MDWKNDGLDDILTRELETIDSWKNDGFDDLLANELNIIENSIDINIQTNEVTINLASTFSDIMHHPSDNLLTNIESHDNEVYDPADETLSLLLTPPIPENFQNEFYKFLTKDKENFDEISEIDIENIVDSQDSALLASQIHCSTLLPLNIKKGNRPNILEKFIEKESRLIHKELLFDPSIRIEYEPDFEDFIVLPKETLD